MRSRSQDKRTEILCCGKLWKLLRNPRLFAWYPTESNSMQFWCWLREPLLCLRNFSVIFMPFNLIKYVHKLLYLCKYHLRGFQLSVDSNLSLCNWLKKNRHLAQPVRSKSYISSYSDLLTRISLRMTPAACTCVRF